MSETTFHRPFPLRYSVINHIRALMILASVLFTALPALAAAPAIEIETRAAIIVAPESYHYDFASRYPSEVSPGLKADALADALKDRVDKLIVLKTREETTRESVIRTLSTLAYEDHYDHVIFIWEGWGMKGLLVRNKAGVHREASSLLLCSDVDFTSVKDGFASLSVSTVSPLEIEKLLEQIGDRQTVIMDANRDPGAYSPTVRGEEPVLINFKGLTAKDWPRGAETTVISPTSEEEATANSFPLAFRDTLRNVKTTISHESLVGKLRELQMGTEGQTLEVPIYYGYSTTGADVFLPEAPKPREATPLKSDPILVTPPFVEQPPEVKPEKKRLPKWTGPVSVGVSIGCLLGSAASTAVYAKAGQDIKTSATLDDFTRYSSRMNTAGAGAIGLGVCAAGAGTLGGLSLGGKF
jgi:hypothetical protein